MLDRWVELAAGVWVVRNRELDLNLGLVLGSRSGLVVDTGFGAAHGAAFAEAIREHTPLPLSVVLTHAHFDHVLGTSAFPGVEVYAHPVCAARLTEITVHDREQWSQECPAFTEEITVSPLVPPTAGTADHTLDLGGRTVRLLHPGRGHTGGDLIVHIPDAACVFAGDLVEQGAEPQAGEDAFPAEWPASLDRLLALDPQLVVPGHGEPVAPAFVAAQREALTAGWT
ncbi:MBL fold metallo-hydrolase [Sciscionella marina]|uniref:MBL fold metallo-hydrolase n=1 Tax=Sciscionella marina TaxID=508770 RepID=UPI000475B97A|nr:MBL fold metallo-hydrolase [Sciscionella marina]